MENFRITAKAVRFKTHYRRDAKGEVTATTRYVKMVAEDGHKFDATISNPDPLFRLGRGKSAIFELDESPYEESYGGLPIITNIYAS